MGTQVDQKHTYVCSFCGCRCTCRETSKEFNRGVLYTTAAVYIIFASVLSGIAVEASKEEEWMILFPWLEEGLQAFVVVASLMLFLAVMLIFSTWRKLPSGIIACMLMMAIILAVQIGYGSLVVEKVSSEDFEEYVTTEYLDNWNALVVLASSDDEVKNFIQSVQEEYNCCGWNDYTDELQNPSYLECTADAETNMCADYFEERISEGFKDIATAAIVFTTFQVTMMVLSCSLIVRFKRFYKPIKVDTGDWTED